VACNPGSLGRDQPVLEAGGWKLTDVWVVDLFPQTGHVEVVGRFIRPG
jgi:23S rRNA (uracil1939-C5)-methyltransferase